MSRLCAATTVLMAACAAAPLPTAQRPERAHCSPTQSWDGTRCRELSADLSELRRGESELAALRPDEAVATLESAAKHGPYRHRDLVRLHEQLSLAYAYLEDEARALASFDMVLALSPGHAISYTLSPKATFLFEKARTKVSQRAQPALHVSWPRDIDVRSSIPVEVEVVADPKSFLSRARVFSRKQGDESFRSVDVALPKPGSYTQLALPPLEGNATGPATLDLYLAAYDKSGNEVLLWGSRDRPREIPLSYAAPTPWFRKWWVWGIAGSVVAVGTGVAVYAATQEPGDRIGGSVVVR